MKLKNIFLSTLGLLGLLTCIVLYLARAKTAGDYYGNTDFFKFYQSVLYYFSGQGLYDYTILEIKYGEINKWVTGNGNLNPPFLTFLFLPLHYFSYAQALRLWVFTSIILSTISIAILLRVFSEFSKPLWKWLLIVTAFFLYMPNSGNLAYGQVTSILLIFLLGAWLAGRNQRDILAGICFGLAASLKVFCGLFYLYLLTTRRWRALISATITYVFVFGATVWIFGISSYRQYSDVLGRVHWYAASWNPSFLGFFTRLFSAAEKNIPLLNLPYLVNPLTMICCAALMIYLFFMWERLRQAQTPSQRQDNFDDGFSLTLIAMLLLSPLGWLYYFPILVIPYFILLRQSAYLSAGYLFHLGACVALLISTLTGNLLITNQIKTIRQVILDAGYPFYALLLMLCLYMLLTHLRLRHTISPMPDQDISENLWVGIYALMFIPSMLSLVKIAEHVAYHLHLPGFTN